MINGETEQFDAHGETAQFWQRNRETEELPWIHGEAEELSHSHGKAAQLHWWGPQQEDQGLPRKTG